MGEEKARILVVDDEWITRLEVSEMLTELGYRVAGKAESGRQGIEMARNLRPDLVLMDIVMPGGMNGIAAAERIKSETDIPVIFISGYGDPEYVEKAKEVEPFGYVMKPFNEDQIRAFIEIALYRKKIVDALHRSENMYRNFVEGTDDLVSQIDRDGVITFVNGSVERFLNMRADQVAGMSVFDFIFPEDLKSTEKILSDFKSAPKPGVIFENRLINATNGKLSDINWTVNPSYDNNGRLLGFSCIGKDYTYQKKCIAAKYASDKLESLGILAGGITHDFNNIMAAVLANIGIAKSYSKPDCRAFDSLSKAERLCVKTRSLTDRLLSLFETTEPNKIAVSVGDFLKITMGKYENDAINCTFSIPEDIAPVKINVAQMKQGIGNILDNSRENMNGNGMVHVSCKNIHMGEINELGLREGKYVKISIKDHGKGIPLENLGKIFDPYFSTKEMGPQKGMGLGLSISDSIVKKHGGIIKAKSRWGKGATFSIYLPAAEN